MKQQTFLILAGLAAAIAPLCAQAQKQPRTAWGDPDLQGQWNSQTSTPLQRPLQGPLAERDTLSQEEAEMAAFEANARDAARAGGK